MTDWCILRTAPASTLHLARSLSEAGFESWTPALVKEMRVGPLRTRTEVPCPAMPGYVLAQSQHLHRLLALSHSPLLSYQVWDDAQQKVVTKARPKFSVFRGGSHRFIPDTDLVELRKAERRPKPKLEPKTFAIGDKVRTSEGGFAGLTATVLGIKGQWVQVTIPGWDIMPTFGSWLLHSVLDESPIIHVSGEVTEQALSAKAA